MFNVKIIGADKNQGPVGAGKDTLVVGSAQLYGIYAFNSSTTTDYFLQVFDSATVPADGATPELVYPLTKGTNQQLQFGDGYVFAAGIYVCASTTSKTKTIATTNDVILQVNYRVMG